MQEITTDKIMINSYQPSPHLPFDIKGEIISKDGKNIALAIEMEGKKREIDLRLKEEIVEEAGEEVEIKKEDIISYKMRPALGLEGAFEDGEGARDVAKILEELGLPHTTDNVALLEHLIKNAMPITKEAISSYMMSNDLLNNLRESLDIESITKLSLEGMDIESESLKKIKDRIEELKLEPEKKTLSQILGLKKDMTTDEAIEVSNKIYHAPMGKDYYDAIKSLSKYGAEITKEKIEIIISINHKLHSLKDIGFNPYIKVEAKSLSFNIENLHREFLNYTSSTIEGDKRALTFDNMMSVGSDLEGVKNLLRSINLPETTENIELARAFAIENVHLTSHTAKEVLDMKRDFDELQSLLSEEVISKLIDEGIDTETTKIPNLLEIIKDEPSDEALDEEPFEVSKEDTPTINLEPSTKEPSTIKNTTLAVEANNTKGTSENISFYQMGKVSYQKLVELLKTGEDFNLNNLKDIERPVIKAPQIEDLTILKFSKLNEMFERIGEIPKPQVINEAIKDEEITLNKLYEAEKSQSLKSEELIHKVNEAERSFITKEYVRMKNSITAQVVRISIEESVDIEHMPIPKANLYIEEKLSLFNKIKDMRMGLERSEGVQNMVLPIIYKNGLELNLKEITSISEFLRGSKGIVGAIESLRDTPFKEIEKKVRTLTEEISDKIKDGEDFRKDYKELINTLLGDSQSEYSDEYKEPEFLNIIKRISKGTNIMQLPIEIDGELNSLNIMMPRRHNSLEKNLFISIETKNFSISLDMTLRGKTLFLKDENIPQSMKPHLKEYEERLSEKGFSVIIK